MYHLKLTLALVVLLFAILVAGRLTDVTEQIKATDVEEIDAEIDLGVGRFELNGNTPKGILAQFVGSYDQRKHDYDIDFRERKEQGQLFFSTEVLKKTLRDIDGDDNEWEISLSPDYTYSLDIDVGAAEADFDFSDLSVSEFDLDVGAADCRVAFSTPNKTELNSCKIDAGACNLRVVKLGNAKFTELEFDGGVGSFLLDFTGEFDFKAEADINVGLGSIEIILPKNIGVQLYADENWFNSIDFSKRKLRQVEEDFYETTDFDDADAQLTIYLDIGMGSADISFE